MKKIFITFVFLSFAAVLSLYAPPVHANPALEGWRKGILIQSQYPTDFSSTNFQQSINNAAADGVNHVSLIVQLHQSSVSSSDVRTMDSTPTDQSLTDGINYIRGKGMQASVNVHVDPNDRQWRAMINPSDRPAWFANYGQQLNHYADIAQSTGAEEVVIGTEMSNLTNPSVHSGNTAGWVNLIQSVRERYQGSMTYSAQHGGNMEDYRTLEFWQYLDEIGISAYYSMGDRSSSVADMQNRWRQIDENELSGLARTYNKPIVFIEAGYVSGDNGLSDPGAAYSNPGPVNLTLQADAYKALLSYWSNSSYLRGVSFWDWSSNPSAGGQNDAGYTPQNKPAEQVMKQWFTGGGTPANSAPATYTANVSSGTAITTNSSTLTTVAVAASQTISNTLVDLEIYDTNGQKVAQRYYENQNLTSSGSQYQIQWTPPRDGQYVVKTGVFTANWQSNLYWDDNVGVLTAKSAQTPPAPTPSPSPSSQLSIWWPSNGSSVQGVQPFKAALDGADPAQYSMFWKVGDGQLNAMPTSYDGPPHKEADVDLSGWTWQSNGQYVITFVAKNNAGNVIAQKSSTITITH